MVVGAVIASASDLAFDVSGFAFIMLNNLLSALVAVMAEQRLIDGGCYLNSWGLIFYNSLITAPMLVIYLKIEQTEVNGRETSLCHNTFLFQLTCYAYYNVEPIPVLARGTLWPQV